MTILRYPVTSQEFGLRQATERATTALPGHIVTCQPTARGFAHCL